MKPKRFAYPMIGIAIAIVLLATPSILLAHNDDDKEREARLVFPPEHVVNGLSYGDWAAVFWQYQASLPTTTSPSFTGTNCLIGQEGGPMFIAPVSFGQPLTATCTIPAGKSIFITVLTDECSTVEPPPFHGDNPQQVRNTCAVGADGIGLDTLRLTVDNQRVVHDFRRFRVQSPSFEFSMPASNNLLNLPGVTSGTSVVDGYFVILRPLPKGQHVIHFAGAFTSGPAAGFAADTVVNLTVQ
jgi:hypothetical protein